MTVEELKIEAAKLGYNIVPKPPKQIKLIPCECGRKQFDRWYTPQGMIFRCPNCGRHSEPANSERKARENWNRMVENEHTD